MVAKAKRAVKLPVSIAAHSELMRVVAGQLERLVGAPTCGRVSAGRTCFKAL